LTGIAKVCSFLQSGLVGNGLAQGAGIVQGLKVQQILEDTERCIVDKGMNLALAGIPREEEAAGT